MNRLVELYNQGGLSEIRRGMRDFTRYKYHHLMNRLHTHTRLPIKGEILGERLVWRTHGEANEHLRANGKDDDVGNLRFLLNNDIANPVFWDIGAHWGLYTIIATKRGATSYAFEPSILNLTFLHEMVQLNGIDPHIIPIGLSDRTAITRFQQDTDLSVHHGINPTGSTVVQAVTGDSITAYNPKPIPSPDIVKIDVEGHEVEVIRGMVRTLKSVQRMVIELHEGVNPNDITHILGDGFTTREETWGMDKRHLLCER